VIDPIAHEIQSCRQITARSAHGLRRLLLVLSWSVKGLAVLRWQPSELCSVRLWKELFRYARATMPLKLRVNGGMGW
jgi:hypothetical protein